MAALSYEHTPFPLDTLFLPPKESMIYSNYLSHHHLYQESSCLDYTSSKPSTTVSDDNNNNNEPSDSVTKKMNTTPESSSVVDLLENGEQVTQRLNPMDRKRKNSSGSSFSTAQSKGKVEEEKKKRQKKSKVNMKKEEEEEKKKQKADKEVEKKGPEEAPKGYIHVRARRGQATDSHSLAERVRREKISERMKILQSLVPGCEKVTGKAMVLDEIINYVQSLQNQVEFLSMKLASTNPMVFDFSLDLDAFSLNQQNQKMMNSLPSSSSSSLPSLVQSSPDQHTAAANNYPLMDTSASLLLHQAQRPNLIAFSQDVAGMLWDVEDHRQKFLNPSGFGNNLCSFH